ncbi:MAG: M23 family metallopeptidase [Bacteroidales bacterium]|nr:M23 family metallopeptidase [Bacteroidales bacterium]
MFIYHPKLLVCFLLSGLLSCGQNATPQAANKKTQSPLIESGRISPGEFDLPMHLTPFLSGSFAELRNNHFHSGIDFKTQHTVGYPVYAVADGWVSRIRISNFGFGYALYVDHPNGFTTVYGHLQKYAPSIADFSKTAQYKNEQFELDTLLKPGLIPVKRGQIIAYSGNAGSSAAPHLHFEIRDTRSMEPIDPLLWYSNRIKDSQPPRFQKMVLYAIDGEGVLSTGAAKAILTTSKTAQSTWTLNGQFPTAWGKVGFGLNAYDYMDQTSNTYGICNISLFEEDEEIFHQDLSRFSFSQTHYVNSLTDYEAWQKNRTWIMKSFLEPGNMLKVYLTAKNRGYISIHEEKNYHFRYELKDRAGNVSEIRFDIQGKKEDIPAITPGENHFESWMLNHFISADAELTIPAGSLYKNIDFKYEQQTSDGFSDIYTLHDQWTPLHQPIPVNLRIQKDDLSNQKAYYLAKKDNYGQFKYVGGKYVKGMIQAQIGEFGTYTVMADTIPPKIIGLNLENAVKNRLFRIRISDDASGIKTWRGTIDNKWVLFEFDCKTSRIIYQFDNSRIIKGKEHHLVVQVSDACGNESKLEYQFYY